MAEYPKLKLEQLQPAYDYLPGEETEGTIKALGAIIAYNLQRTPQAIEQPHISRQPPCVTVQDIVDYHASKDNCVLCVDYAQRKQQPAPLCGAHRSWLWTAS